MTVFVDTSGLYAMIDAADRKHRVADRLWGRLLDEGVTLRTHSYVVVETGALVQHRLGMAAVRVLHTDVVPALSVRFVDSDLHTRAVTALLAAGRRQVSLVDWASFELMREEHLIEALAFDDDFSAQGFTTLC